MNVKGLARWMPGRRPLRLAAKAVVAAAGARGSSWRASCARTGHAGASRLPLVVLPCTQGVEVGNKVKSRLVMDSGTEDLDPSQRSGSVRILAKGG